MEREPLRSLIVIHNLIVKRAWIPAKKVLADPHWPTTSTSRLGVEPEIGEPESEGKCDVWQIVQLKIGSVFSGDNGKGCALAFGCDKTKRFALLCSNS